MAKRRITKKRAALKKEQCTGPVNWDFARFLGLLTQGRLDEIIYDSTVDDHPSERRAALEIALETAFVNEVIDLETAKSILKRNEGEHYEKKFEDRLWFFYPNLCDKNTNG
jgi:hypothetical protein